MKEDKEILGWYWIDSKWNLYIDSVLEKVYVSWICVDFSPNNESYHVDHYGTDGKFLTSERLEYEDIKPVVKDKTKEERPWYI